MAAKVLSMAGGSAVRVAGCALTVTPEPWPFAAQREAEIVAHWERRRAQSPKLFDGIVHLLRTSFLEAGTFTATLMRTDFKSFLYWRELGYPNAGVRDGFGSAVIRSAEGHVLLGRQSAGNLNEGRIYPPGGFIDARDVRDGSVDIEASIVRELGEETGLEQEDLVRVPGFLVAASGPLVSMAVEWRSALSGEALRDRILAHVNRQAVPELADIVIVRGADAIDDCAYPGYTKALLGALLSTS